jgi:O-antigen/teichoic acid export membrane protein
MRRLTAYFSPESLRMSDDVPVKATAALVSGADAADDTSHRRLRERMLSGSAVMLLSSVFVGCMNLVYNFAVAHELGADRYGHASVVYTLLMLLSSITLSFQLLCSKFVARSDSSVEKIAIYQLLHRWAWICGVLVGALLALASGAIAGYLNVPSSRLILYLGAAIVFYVPLGTRRGFMQGSYAFRRLAVNFALEVTVKLVGAVALMTPFAVQGVVIAIAASVVVAYFAGFPNQEFIAQIPGATLRSGVGEGVQAATFFIGQVIINNVDIVLVKHFFDATQAGVYAAIALVGRVVYMLSWSVVSSMFPFSAGIRSGDKGGHTVLTTALGLVAVIASLFTLGAWLAPRALWQMLLGHGFPVAHYSSLLVLYALTTGIYVLGAVLMAYEISQKIGRVSWLQLAFSGMIVGGIYLFHSTLQMVITVQLVVMLGLLFVVSVPFVRAQEEESRASSSEVAYPRELRKLHRVSEDEVIAQFLQGEFYQDEFRRYRESFATLVNQPDLNDPYENALRRALLFRRRGLLWQEVPPDTEWWEVELSPADLSRVRVFARRQWLRYGAPGFSFLGTVDKIRSRIASHSRDPFIVKLRSLSEEMIRNVEYSSVILISLDEFTPITILEGNHRMTAAALVSPEMAHQRFRFVCGFSPHMAECCWYRTDVSTLWKYAVNTVAYYLVHRQKFNAAILEAEARLASPPGVNAA